MGKLRAPANPRRRWATTEIRNAGIVDSAQTRTDHACVSAPREIIRYDGVGLHATEIIGVETTGIDLVTDLG